MAHGIDLTKLKSLFLQCNICTNDYNEGDHHPRIFPCLHGACFSCVKTLIKDCALVCPNCRRHYDVPGENVDIFLKDNTRRDLLNFVQVQDSTVVICDNCSDVADKKKHAINRCKVCAQFLCKDCSSYHQKIKAFRDHGLINLEDLKNKCFNFEDFALEGQCLIEGHNLNRLTLYCQNDECQLPICMTCAFCRHQGHNIQNIDEVFQARKQSLMEQIEDLNMVILCQNKAIASIEHELRHVNNNIEASQKDIDDQMVKCVTVIENKRKEHNRKLVDIKQDKYKCLHHQQNDIQDLLNQTEESCEFAKQALHYRNPSAFLVIEKTISERLRELQDTHFETDPHTNSHIRFDGSNVQEIVEAVVPSLGAIRYSSAFLPKTIVKAPSLLKFRSCAKIEIMLYDRDENALTEDGADVAVEISNESQETKTITAFPVNIHSENTEVEDCNESIYYAPGKRMVYTACFEPSAPGTYTATIQVCGRNVPQKITIKCIDCSQTETYWSQLESKEDDFFNTTALTQRYLKCTSCNESFDSKSHFPRLLPCLHQVGESCFQTLATHNDQIRCTICSEEHKIEEELNYPDNSPFQQQLQDFIFAQQGNTKLERYCSCESRKKISYWCRECSSFMCEDCKRAHNQLSFTKVHELISLQGLSIKPSDVEKFGHVAKCCEADHKNQEIPLYCSECKKALCVLCVLTHRYVHDHERYTQSIKEVYDKESQITKSHIADLDERIHCVAKLVGRVEEEEERMKIEAEKVNLEIKGNFEQIHHTLNKREKHLAKSVNNILLEEKEIVLKQKEELQAYKLRLQDCREVGKLALLYKNPPAFLNVKDILNNRMIVLYYHKLENQPRVCGDMAFNLDERDIQCINQFSKIGQIVHSTAYLPASEISVPANVEMENSTIIDIQLRNSAGHYARGNIDGIKIGIIDPDGKYNDVIASKTESSHRLYGSWKPSIVGKHFIYVYVKGHEERFKSESVTCTVEQKVNTTVVLGNKKIEETANKSVNPILVTEEFSAEIDDETKEEIVHQTENLMLVPEELTLSTVTENETKEELGNQTENLMPLQKELTTVTDDVGEIVMHATLVHSFENISKFPNTGKETSTFHKFQKLDWRIEAKKREIGNDNYIGVFLRCENDEYCFWSCKAKFVLKILKVDIEEMPVTKEGISTFSDESTIFGIRNLYKWGELLDPSNGFIKDDKITIQIDIDAEKPTIEIFKQIKKKKIKFKSRPRITKRD